MNLDKEIPRSNQTTNLIFLCWKNSVFPSHVSPLFHYYTHTEHFSSETSAYRIYGEGIKLKNYLTE